MTMWAFREIEAEQRSEEWFAARAGRLTGSKAGDILAKIKTGEAAARRDYRLQLVCERITGKPQEDVFVNAAMQRGIDLEPMARAALEAQQGYLVRTSGFLMCNQRMAGCSLDGDVDDFSGIVELKCPKSATHLRYLRERVMPKEHLPQVLHNLMVTGATWCDFASFDDRFPAHLQLFVVRVVRTDVDVDLIAYENEAERFLAEVQKEYEEVSQL